MRNWSIRLWWGLLCLLLFPSPAPAPLIYRPGEGWTYERVGGGKWRRTRAKDQLEVAQQAFDNKNYGTTLKAARRVVKEWPLSDYAPQAQYLMGRSYEAKKLDQRAFQEYQKLLEKYPKVENYQEVLERQFQIANRFLAGQWFKLWGYIPFFPNMEKTVEMYDKLIKNGPYSGFAPQAQMNIGKAREKQSNYSQAVKAYERAADRYNDQKKVAADALFNAGMAYYKQARTAEYDQNVAGLAIATFGDFMTLNPNDARVGEAQRLITSLKTEQARGSFEIARYYEKKGRLNGALIYYNDTVSRDPDSKLAEVAKQRMDAIKKRAGQSNQTAQK
jgi:outer membrane protein assembly factor BamD